MELLGMEDIFGTSAVTAVAATLIIVLGAIYYFDVGAPPGPRGLPYFGYWPFLSNEKAHLELTELKKKYGDVFSFKVTGHLIVHLGSIKALKEAYVHKADCFTQRYQGFSVIMFLFEKGLLSLKDEGWKVHRKFFVQAFKEFGFSSTKKYMDGPIYDALATTVKTLRAEGEKPVNLIPILSFHCSALLRRMLFNDDGITDEEMNDLIEGYKKTFNLFAGTTPLISGEFARRCIFPLMKDYRVAQKSLKEITEIFLGIFRRREETYKEDSIRDVIDAYFRERNARLSKNDPMAESFSNHSLASSLLQIVGDGSLGVAVFVGFFFNALLEHPEEQEKLYKELEEVLGPDRDPTMEDKKKLTLMNAFINEVMRTSDFFTMFPGAECTKETTLNGHPVPKGAITLMNFWAIHHDPEVFDDPDEFKPERYLPGTQKAELPITFGVGKRACAGEQFSMVQVFLFLATVVKNFRLERPCKSDKNVLYDAELEVIAIPRKSEN